MMRQIMSQKINNLPHRKQYSGKDKSEAGRKFKEDAKLRQKFKVNQPKLTEQEIKQQLIQNKKYF